jgi:hypothetical protein
MASTRARAPLCPLSAVRSSQMALLGHLDLDLPSPPADVMQNFGDSRPYPTAPSPIESSPTAPSPIESSRRAESIAHRFAVQWRFSTLISWIGSSFVRRGTGGLAQITNRGGAGGWVGWVGVIPAGSAAGTGVPRPIKGQKGSCVLAIPPACVCFRFCGWLPKGSARDGPGRCRCGC